jgi:hypothetical protein
MSLLREEDRSDRWYMRNAEVAKSDVTAVSASSRSMYAPAAPQ